MPDDSNLWRIPKKHICQGNMYLSKSKTTLQKYKSAKKNYFLLIS
jgi:hypothetical protein